MWADNPIAKRLGIDLPLIQAPMAAVSTPAMAAAVSNAGGLGMLASAMLTPDGFVEAMATVRQATNKPFGVNFFVHDMPELDAEREAKLRAHLAPYYDELGIDQPGELPIAPRFDDGMLEAVVETTPAVVTFHFGLPERMDVDAVKAAGAAVLSSATPWPKPGNWRPTVPMRSLPRATRRVATAALSRAHSRMRKLGLSRWCRRSSTRWPYR